MEEITKRDVVTRHGTFHFELVEYPGPSPLVNVHLDDTNMGWAYYINLGEASDLDLLQLASEIVYLPDEFDDLT